MNWLSSFVRNLTEPADTIRVLAVKHNDPDTVALTRIAEKANWHIEFATSYRSAAELIGEQAFAVILCDRDLTRGEGWREAVKMLACSAPESCVILTSPFKDDQLWQAVIHCGGYDVLTKPFQQQRVVRAVHSACLMKSRLCAPRTESTPEFPLD